MVVIGGFAERGRHQQIDSLADAFIGLGVKQASRLAQYVVIVRELMSGGGYGAFAGADWFVRLLQFEPEIPQQRIFRVVVQVEDIVDCYFAAKAGCR